MKQFSRTSSQSTETELRENESNDNTHARMEYLEKRVDYLEEVTRFALDAIEMAASLGDFQQSINKLHDASVILDETRSRIHRLIQFNAVAFYLIDEESNEFYPASFTPQDCERAIRDEVSLLIDDGTFAWALRNKKPVTVASKTHQGHLLLHAMATTSRIRGMFVGMTRKTGLDIPDTALALLSVILLSSSNALESYELYKMIRGIGKSLESKENCRILFEAAPDGVEVLDPLGRIVDCNRAFVTLIGRSREGIVGKHTSAFLSDKSKDLWGNAFPALKKNGYQEGEVEFLCSSGSITPVWRKENAVYDEQMNFVGSVAYNRDLSALRRAENEKKALEAQVQQTCRLEAMGTLVGGIAHEFNNVLTPIMGYGELTLRDVPEGSKVESNLRQMMKGAARAKDLVKRIILFSRQSPEKPQPVEMALLVNECLELLRATIPKTIEIRESVVSESLVLADPSQIHQIMLNLCTNAVHAMREQGGRLEVSLEDVDLDSTSVRSYPGLNPGQHVRLTVSDSGHGMDKITSQRIFDPFFTTKEPGEGSGMGLAVVHGIVTNHAGAIHVRTAPGAGTSFDVFFPIIRHPVPLQNETEAPVAQGKQLILFVDDEEALARVAGEILEHLGYRVVTETSSLQALDVFRTSPDAFDLVITDHAMPQMTGIELAAEVMRIRPDVPIILCSGFTDHIPEAQALQMGIRGLTMKPLSFRGLAEMVRRVLDKE